MIDQPTAAAALEKLQPLVGQWRMLATPPGGESWPGEARATFERHASGAHLAQTTTVDAPQAPDTIAIIGCDAANGTYYQLYSDDRGVCRVYEMSITDAVSQWLSRARLGSQNTAVQAATRNPTATSSA